MISAKRLRAIALMIFGCLGGYVAIQKIAPLLTHERYILTLPGESTIPFVPEMILIYTLIYVLPVVMMVMLGKSRHFGIILEIFTMAALIHFFFFLVMPVHYELRPPVTESAGSWFVRFVAVYYRMDDTTNCFPSMHVSFAFLSYFCIRQYRPKFANAFLISASAIALSTLLVKQHYILDVVSAIALAALMAGLIKAYPRYSVLRAESPTNDPSANPPSA